MPEPIANERSHVTPSAIVPIAISVDIPPTSTTAMEPSGGRGSVRVAPANASRPSSSADSTATSTPARARSAATSAPRLAARRIAAVATTRTCAAPASSAAARWAATTSATAAIAGSGIAPTASILRPMRVNARCSSTGISRPRAASATSSRVVFDPMSMQAQRMDVRGRLP
jgi:hypothetical protein